MGLNETPSADRVHIGIFGRRNAGKSSIINAITGQDAAIVSEIKGTTTDPVYKAMELLPIGPVMLIDTPGLDDVGELGRLRIEKSYKVLNKTDIALLIIDSADGLNDEDERLIKRIEKKEIPYIIVLNKADIKAEAEKYYAAKIKSGVPVISVSSKTGSNIHELKELIAKQARQEDLSRRIVGDIISSSDFVVLVVPVDSAAPKGRLILPQQQTIRDILDADAVSIVVKETDLSDTLTHLAKKPRLVITDSQAFAKVSADTPDDIMLTSFSILFARYKGDLAEAVKGAAYLDSLTDGDKVLISEGCTHHRQCDDIGTVKLPRWILKHTGKRIDFEFSSGAGFPDDLTRYKLIVHCGGCMLNDREMKYRVKCAKDQNVPITNYGTAIAYMNGILKRTLAPFPDIASLLDK